VSSAVATRILNIAHRHVLHTPDNRTKQGTQNSESIALRRLSQKSFSERYTEVSAQFEAEALRLAPVGQVTLLNEEKKPARATATNCLRSDPCQGSYGPLALTG
jgi:hypothetical protein